MTPLISTPRRRLSAPPCEIVAIQTGAAKRAQSREPNRRQCQLPEIFGAVVSVTTFKTDEDALSIANDTLYGLGAGVWSRDANRCYRFRRAIQAGRACTNCYRADPAHAAFGGYKQSGVGRETHKMMLDHYQQTKNMLVSYSPKKLGFF